MDFQKKGPESYMEIAATGRQEIQCHLSDREKKIMSFESNGKETP